MNQQQAKTRASFEYIGSDSIAVPLFQEETTAAAEEVELDIQPSSISQPQSGAAFAANSEELTKAMAELHTLLGELEGTRQPSPPSESPASPNALWPEDLNTGEFRGTVNKSTGPDWGFDPGFTAVTE